MRTRIGAIPTWIRSAPAFVAIAPPSFSFISGGRNAVQAWPKRPLQTLETAMPIHETRIAKMSGSA